LRGQCRPSRRSPISGPPTLSSGTTATHVLQPVSQVSRVDISLLKGIDRMRDILSENTERFARGLPANNVLLWGARGMGKSSLIKAAHAAVNTQPAHPLKLIEIHREDIETLPEVMALLRGAPHRFLLFCDDLSFDGNDASYKSLKAALEGGIEGRPANVLFYATSNRRHLLPRDMTENEASTAIMPGEAVEEKVSLSDRFGLWLGFHKCSQDEYLEMVRGYVAHYGLRIRSSNCGRRLWSGRRHAVRARAGSPGSMCRIWRADLGSSCEGHSRPARPVLIRILPGGQD
jgi:predicted AAA+ superfamily ATPase